MKKMQPYIEVLEEQIDTYKKMLLQMEIAGETGETYKEFKKAMLAISYGCESLQNALFRGKSCDTCRFEHNDSNSEPCNVCSLSYISQYKPQCDRCGEYSGQNFCAECGKKLDG